MNIQKIGKRNIIFTWSVPDGWDVNIHVIQGKQAIYIIDTGLGSDTIIEMLDILNIKEKQIIVINTHYHWDHIWGNHMFQGYQIISHSLCRAFIDQKWEEMIDNKGKYIMGDTKPCLPTITFEQEIYFHDDQIRLFYSPGHTRDSISVVDEEDYVINIGDNIGDDMFDIIPSITSQKEDYINTLRLYLDLNVKYYVSGHNMVVDKKVIKNLLDLALEM